jgi:hypothetical protein
MPGHATADKMHGNVQQKDPGNAGTIRCRKALSYFALVSAAGETRTLARPTRVGDLLTLAFKTDGGDITLTVTGGYDEIASTSLVFTDAGQLATFVSCYDGTSYFWRLTYANVPGVGPFAGGGLVTIADGTTYTVLAANSGKVHTLPDLTSTITLTMPTPVAGLTYEFWYRGVAADAQNWVIDTGSNTNYFLGGLMFADHDSAGVEIAPIAGNGSSNSKLTVVTPDVGTWVKVVANGTQWILNGYVNSATIPSFADQ